MDRTMKTIKRLVVLMAMLACVAGFAAPSSAAPKETLLVGIEAETYSMDPLEAWMTYGISISRQMYDSLVEFDPYGKFVPRLATSWQLLNDLTWRFHLRKGVKFHNGYPFTAADVKFTFERILDPANRCKLRSFFINWDKFIIIDDYTIDIKTKTPDPLVLNRHAFFGRIVSKKWVEENGVEMLRRHAMGTGPFKFVSWKRNDRLTLEANTDHYMNVPKVKTLIFRPIPVEASRVAELQAGGAHIITKVPPFMIPQLEKDPNTTIQKVLSLRCLMMVMNTFNVPELKDKQVRQALNYGVNKEAIIKGLLKGLGKPIGVGAGHNIRGIDKSIKPYPYDPGKAKALLKEAGYPNGFKLNLYSPSGRYPMDKEVVQAVADQLSKLDIKPKVHVMETGKYFKEYVKHNLNGLFITGHAILQWDVDAVAAFADPESAWSHYHNPEMLKLIHKMRSIVDDTARYKVAHQLQRMMHEEAPHLFLFNEEVVTGLSKKVQGFQARADENMDLWNVSLVD